MKRKIFAYFIVVIAVFGIALFTFLVYAKAPTEEEIKAEQAREEVEARARIEAEIAGPPAEALVEHGAAEKPEFEEPGKIPEEVRKYVSDAQIIPIYCAMTKWKSGQLFIAMEAMKKYLIPALEKVKNNLGIGIDIPGIDSLTAEGQKRIEAICGVRTIDEADRLTREFLSWGQQIESAQFGSLSKDLSVKMQAKGNEFRQKIEAEINPLIEADKVKSEEEIKSAVNAYVATIKFDHEPSTAELAAAQAQIDQFVQSKVAAKKAELQQKVQAKVEEVKAKIMGPFMEVADSLKAVGPKIDAEIKANVSRYDQYKLEAFRLRKAVVFSVLDKNLEEGLKQLEAAAADLEEAKKSDPSVKTIGEIKAELMQDRKALEAKLGATLEAGDEVAFQNALNDFRVKWENIRAESEKAGSQGITKGCTMAAAQFRQARAQIDSQLPKILDLEIRCADSTSDECIKVNEFLPRFETITKKLTDLKAEMDIAEKICQNSEQADRENLITLFRKIKTDAEDAKIFGEALEAEKSKAIADSFQKICAQVLPQLRAGKTELEKSEFASLKKTLEECRGKNDDRCKIVNQLTSSFNALNARLTSLNKNLAEVETLCQKGGDETQMEQLRTVLNVLKGEGGEIRIAAKNLQAEAADKASSKALCRSILPSLTEARAKIAAGLQDVKSIQDSCPSTVQGCQRLLELAAALKTKTEKMIKRIGGINSSCDSAPATPPTSDFIIGLQSARVEAGTLLKDVDQLKLEGEKLKKEGSGQIWMEAENETRSSLLPHTEAWHSHKWTKPAPWRPPLFGTGYWYLSRGGEYLEYQFTVSAAGTYNVWIRDYVDKFQPKGVRVVAVSLDGKKYGAFPEVDKPAPSDIGAFGWHKVGSGISLSAGSHTMRITKEATTAGAAVLDAFYFTTGSEIPAEK